MDKILTILRSEYLRRVRTRGFILTTLLLPAAIVLFLSIVVLLTVSAFGDEEQRTVAVLDETGRLAGRLASYSDEGLRFRPVVSSTEFLREAVLRGDFDGFLQLPEGIIEGEGRVFYYTAETAGSIFEERLDERVEEAVEAQRLAEQNVTPEVLALLNKNVPLRTVRLTETGEEAGSTGVFIGLGFGMGFLIFMMMVVYGSVVMQGVIDEKTNRVVEVIVSSVRPFQLMMGKVLGIGAVGLTQMVAWSVLVLGATAAAAPLIALFVDPGGLDLPDSASTAEVLEAMDITIPAFSPMIFVWFVCYFFLGYLLYASFYAAVGSLVESQQESQGFLIPLLLPLIVAMYTLVPQVENPDSTLAVVMSMIPLTAPISMVVRVAVTDVPVWEVLLSLLLLAAAFLSAVWLAARIYRVGILMYGKRPSLKDLARWVRYA